MNTSRDPAGYEKDLSHKNPILKTFIESVVDLIFLKDVQGNYLEVNREFCAFFELTPEEVIGRSDREIFDNYIHSIADKTDEEVLKTSQPVTYELEILNKGKRFILETVKTPLRVNGDSVLGIVGITRDITTKKINEEVIRTSQMLLAQSERQSLSGSFEYDTNKQLLFCSYQLLKNLGFSKLNRTVCFEEFLERIYEPERKIYQEEILHSVRQRKEFVMDHRCTRMNDEKIIYCRTHLIPDIKRIEAGFFFGVLSDLSTDRQLKNSITDIQEREKKAIAANLHDSLGQKLVAAKMFLSDLESPIDQIQRALQLVDQSINEIRSISKSLALSTIEGQGLKMAILDVISTLPKTMVCKYDLDIEEEKISIDVSVHLFRIIQEAITNIIKYSQANLIEVKMIEADDIISLDIIDNGIGFDSTQQSSSGNGLRNFRERVAQCHGVLKINASSGNGTHIHIKAPFK